MTIKPKSPFDKFMDALVDELIAMPDDEVLENTDPAAVQAGGLEMLRAAKADAARRRMAAAKAGVATARAQHAAIQNLNISVSEARQYLQQASNDSRYTLAARSLGELTDDEILRLYAQMKTLEANGGKNGPST